MAGTIGPIAPDDSGPSTSFESFVERFLGTYRRYGPVIRAWMEDQVGDRDIDRLGVKAFTAIGDRLGQRMREAGVDIASDEQAAVGALMAMLERVSYGVASGRFVDEGRRAARHAHDDRAPRVLRGDAVGIGASRGAARRCRGWSCGRRTG